MVITLYPAILQQLLQLLTMRLTMVPCGCGTSRRRIGNARLSLFLAAVFNWNRKNVTGVSRFSAKAKGVAANFSPLSDPVDLLTYWLDPFHLVEELSAPNRKGSPNNYRVVCYLVILC